MFKKQAAKKMQSKKKDKHNTFDVRDAKTISPEQHLQNYVSSLYYKKQAAKMKKIAKRFFELYREHSAEPSKKK